MECFFTATTMAGGLMNWWDACCPSQAPLSRSLVATCLSLDIQINHTHDKAQRLTFAIDGETEAIRYTVHAPHHHNWSSISWKTSFDLPLACWVGSTAIHCVNLDSWSFSCCTSLGSAPTAAAEDSVWLPIAVLLTQQWNQALLALSCIHISW